MSDEWNGNDDRTSDAWQRNRWNAPKWREIDAQMWKLDNGARRYALVGYREDMEVWQIEVFRDGEVIVEGLKETLPEAQDAAETMLQGVG